MATLREGSPAPAPSRIMLAAAKPFISNLDNPPLLAERPFALTSAPTAGFAPVRSEGAALGLMSGRGLY